MELQTERLLLRNFRHDDWPAVLAYQSDPRYLQYYHWADRTPDDVQRFVQMFLDHQHEQPRITFQLAVTLRAGGALIGNCGIRLKSAGAFEGEIGYELNPAYRGQGYATEAASAMVAFGFTQLDLHHVSAWCIAENTASAHVLRKLGMQQEGHLRENEHFKGRWWDTLVFGMLVGEWQARNRH